MSLNFTNELLPLRSEPKSNLASLFFVARRRGTNETDAPKQSKSTDRASKGRIFEGRTRTDCGVRRRHSLPAERPNFFPSFRATVFGDGARPPFSKWSTRQGTTRASPSPTPLPSALGCAQLGRSSWLSEQQHQNAFLPHKSYTFIFSTEEREGDGRENRPTHPLRSLVRPQRCSGH